MKIISKSRDEKLSKWWPVGILAVLIAEIFSKTRRFSEETRCFQCCFKFIYWSWKEIIFEVPMNDENLLSVKWWKFSKCQFWRIFLAGKVMKEIFLSVKFSWKASSCKVRCFPARHRNLFFFKVETLKNVSKCWQLTKHFLSIETANLLQ